MDEKDLQDLLLEKLEREHQQFRWEIMKLPKDQIFDRAYEIAIRADIKGYIESEELSPSDCKALLSKDNTLDMLYNDWDNVDSNHTEDIKTLLYYTCEYEPEQKRQADNQNERKDDTFEQDGATDNEDELEDENGFEQ